MPLAAFPLTSMESRAVVFSKLPRKYESIQRYGAVLGRMIVIRKEPRGVVLVRK